jgi:hypothetical protein
MSKIDIIRKRYQWVYLKNAPSGIRRIMDIYEDNDLVYFEMGGISYDGSGMEWNQFKKEMLQYFNTTNIRLTLLSRYQRRKLYEEGN